MCALGVALFGSLIATAFISGMHLALAICVGLTFVIVALAQLLRVPVRS